MSHMWHCEGKRNTTQDIDGIIHQWNKHQYLYKQPRFLTSVQSSELHHHRTSSPTTTTQQPPSERHHHNHHHNHSTMVSAAPLPTGLPPSAAPPAAPPAAAAAPTPLTMYSIFVLLMVILVWGLIQLGIGFCVGICVGRSTAPTSKGEKCKHGSGCYHCAANAPPRLAALIASNKWAVEKFESGRSSPTVPLRLPCSETRPPSPGPAVLHGRPGEIITTGSKVS